MTTAIIILSVWTLACLVGTWENARNIRRWGRAVSGMDKVLTDTRERLLKVMKWQRSEDEVRNQFNRLLDEGIK